MSLQSGYKRLEYIESTGTQYIDTEYIPNPNTTMEAELLMSGTFKNVDDYGGANSIFCVSNGTSIYSMNFGAGATQGNIVYTWLNKTYESGAQIEDLVITDTIRTNRNKLVIGKGRISWGTASRSVTAKTTTQTTSLVLFGDKTDGAIRVFTSYNMRVFSWQIKENETIVRDFIPAKRLSDNAIGLYDNVEKKFYANAGTGTFEAGPEVGVATPENFRLSSSTETTAMLAWSAVDGATGYKLYRDGILIATLTDTSYTDTIQPFTSYLYTLTAYNDSGESDPATISVQVIIPPEAPSNFRASSASMAAIELAWDAVTGAENYQLSRDGAVIYTGSYPSYTDRGLTAETAYTYTLFAVNTAGSSAETTLEATTTQFILVTDRTAADLEAQNSKGTYNASDLNRVGEAMNYVADRLRAAGYDPHISQKTDWKNEDWVDQAAQAVYLGDLAELRKQFTMLASTPEVPPRILATAINSNDGLTYTWANDIEQILMDIDALLTNIDAGRLYSGEIYSWEV